MLLKRFYDEKLAQASYLLGCQRTGDALVVDPNRDIEQYLEAAEAEGLRVAHVTETHIHADFVSGSRELAHRTGARLYLSAAGDKEWQYGFAAASQAILVKAGSHFKVGNIAIEVLHTPGHTPEHICFLVTDTVQANRPMGILSGDFIFVGDVGRPDLLERVADHIGTMERSARQLYRSVQQLQPYPDYLQVWPGHGAGSACGKSLGAVPQSTLGYERLFNWAFQPVSENDFVGMVLAGQPEPPKYFAEMKRINRDGPRILGGLKRPDRLPTTELARLLASGATVVDTRSAADFARGYVPGTLNIPMDRSFTTWAGWLLSYDRDFYLIARGELVDASSAVQAAARDLAMIGLDRLAGYFDSTDIRALAQQGTRLGVMAAMTPAQLMARVGDGAITVIDVRGQAEWDAGHVPGVRHIPLGYLGERAGDLPRDRPVVVHCQSGGRSAIAASLLAAAGFEKVFDLSGGFAAWTKLGFPVDASPTVEARR